MTSDQTLPAELAELAVRALLLELDLYPKPGLVSPVDSGSHRDMDYGLLRKSAGVLFEPFHELAAAAAGGCSFPQLAEIGVAAENRMLEATGGVNTHRGAIFSLGLIVAGAALAGRRAGPDAIRACLMKQWGSGLASHESSGMSATSHGGAVRRATGVGGARAEAAAGFPSVFDVALPHLLGLKSCMVPPREAAIETFFVLMAQTADTNLLHRAGEAGSSYARSEAKKFLSGGGVRNQGWEGQAVAIHQAFVSKNLSPGGAADLLGATLFLDSWLGS